MYSFVDSIAVRMLPFFETFVLVLVFALLGIAAASVIHATFEAFSGNKRLGIFLILATVVFLWLFYTYRNAAIIFGYFSTICLLLFLRMLVSTFRKVNSIVK